MKRILSFALLVVVWGLLNGCSLSGTHLEQLENLNTSSSEDDMLVSLNEKGDPVQIGDEYFDDGQAQMYSSKKGELPFVMNSGKKERPFQGTFELKSDPIPVGHDYTLKVKGTGTIQQMGRTELKITKEINVDRDGIWTVYVIVRVEIAKGDNFLIEFDAEVDLTGLPYIVFTGKGELTAGTGKFENATGEVYYTGKINWDRAKGSAELYCEIDY